MMTRTLLLAALLFPLPTFAYEAHACENNESKGYACSHVEYLGHMTRAQLGAMDAEYVDVLNDMWGWTDPDNGDEYVVVGMYYGAAFVDVTDPENPVFLGRLPAPPPPNTSSVQCHGSCGEQSGPLEEEGDSSWMDVKVFRDHAYIVSEQSNFGMQIFDMKRLRDATSAQTFTADAHFTGFGDAHNIFINEQSGFAYVIGNTTAGLADETDPNFGGLLVYDLSDPVNPVKVADYDEIQYVHDVQCVMYDGPDTEYAGREICFASNSGWLKNPDGTYVSEIADDGTDLFHSYSRLIVLDVTDKTAIQQLSQVKFFDGMIPDFHHSYIHQSWLDDQHEFLMVNDEIKARYENTRTTSYVFDVRNLDAISLHADYLHSTVAVPHNEYVKGSFSYQANYSAGLRVLDVSSPANPLQVAYFDTQPSDDTEYHGTWTAYPFFESGTVAMSDMEDGLFLVRTVLQEEKLAPDIAVAGELLLVDSADDVFYVAYANNGPTAATEVDFTFHLPPGVVFNDAVPPEGLKCSAADRVVTCQAENIASCATGLVSLPLDASLMQGDQEVVAMAAAKEIEAAAATKDNLVRIQAGKGETTVDTGKLESALLSANCTTPITVDAGGDQAVMSGDEVTLALAVDFFDNLLTDVAWEQVEGPSVTLDHPAAPQTVFTAPEVGQPTDLVFRVAVMNAYGMSSEDVVTVTVNPKPVTPDGNGGGGGGAWLYFLWLGLLGFRQRR